MTTELFTKGLAREYDNEEMIQYSNEINSSEINLKPIIVPENIDNKQLFNYGNELVDTKSFEFVLLPLREQIWNIINYIFSTDLNQLDQDENLMNNYEYIDNSYLKQRSVTNNMGILGRKQDLLSKVRCPIDFNNQDILDAAKKYHIDKINKMTEILQFQDYLLILLPNLNSKDSFFESKEMTYLLRQQLVTLMLIQRLDIASLLFANYLTNPLTYNDNNNNTITNPNTNIDTDINFIKRVKVDNYHDGNYNQAEKLDNPDMSNINSVDSNVGRVYGNRIKNRRYYTDYLYYFDTGYRVPSSNKTKYRTIRKDKCSQLPVNKPRLSRCQDLPRKQDLSEKKCTYNKNKVIYIERADDREINNFENKGGIICVGHMDNVNCYNHDIQRKDKEQDGILGDTVQEKTNLTRDIELSITDKLKVKFQDEINDKIEFQQGFYSTNMGGQISIRFYSCKEFGHNYAEYLAKTNFVGKRPRGRPAINYNYINEIVKIREVLDTLINPSNERTNVIVDNLIHGGLNNIYTSMNNDHLFDQYSRVDRLISRASAMPFLYGISFDPNQFCWILSTKEGQRKFLVKKYGWLKSYTFALSRLIHWLTTCNENDYNEYKSYHEGMIAKIKDQKLIDTNLSTTDNSHSDNLNTELVSNEEK